MTDIKLSAGAGDGRTDRGGTDVPPRVPRRGAAVSRHGTISRELTKYSNYKTWADKVRTAWRKEDGEEPVEPAPGNGRR
ncbi:MAG: hypothetical protein EXR87_00700 [Gammaproteobacteria bacterium]|nr:hypothetical protein [Gammaproteobacteria bacterium]